ncbi:LamG-like jellyroll fold domain-containing protein [Planctomicrobium sp. SH661]|uniref:LamG domain-containing protein n=1 Tax=Planctomicrobium sp. SH661 TaxID=3448124 RepID=UPI003F5AFD80
MTRTAASLLLFFAVFSLPANASAEFRAGAAVVDVTPDQLPVIVNGGMTSRSLDKVKSRLSARAIVLAEGDLQLAIVVVDSCMMPREFLDDAKKLASDATGITTDRMLISATHTHSAGSVMACLGTEADPNYVPLLRAKLVEAIQAAQKNLEPARVGFGVINAADFTALRRWIRRPDRVETDPFGNATLRANMHAARNPDDVIGESGPEDPDLSLISFQSTAGRPIAVLANFSMHYFVDNDISADYYGLFSEGLKERIAAEDGSGAPPFVGIMSHGCSGDIWRHDYTRPDSDQNKHTIETFTNGLLDLAMQAYNKIEYHPVDVLEMVETRIPLNYRVPTKERLEWAKRVVAEMGDRLPSTTEEVYAREQILLDEMQSTEVVVQAIRIGDIAIATTPTETYALTGLKLKLQSPFKKTIVIELANGGDGYIPPPEQHLLGGYNTWPARSAGLEVEAEPKIAAVALQALQQVCAQPRRVFEQSQGAATLAILDLNPTAYYRLDEFTGPLAKDASPHHRNGIYESRVVYFLEGPHSDLFCEAGETNRSAHFAGERLRLSLPQLADKYTISFWFWNGMPANGRDVTGWMYSRGADDVLGADGEHLGLGGTSGHQSRLIFQQGNRTEFVGGKTEIPRWSWNHVVLTRDGDQVKVFLNGKPEIETTSPPSAHLSVEEFFLGGRSDNQNNWEGRLDEIAIFDRVLSPQELQKISVQ